MEQDSKDLNMKAKEFNEFLLKQTAITFSLEGISRDLKNILQKKIYHNRINLTQISHIIQSLMCSDSNKIKEDALKNGSPVMDLFKHIIKEIKVTDTMLNLVASSALNREASLSEEKNTMTTEGTHDVQR